MSATSSAIVADRSVRGRSVTEPFTDLTPGQALDLIPHAQRRLERRARALDAAEARYLLAYYHAAQLDRLASEARNAWPVR